MGAGELTEPWAGGEGATKAVAGRGWRGWVRVEAVELLVDGAARARASERRVEKARGAVPLPLSSPPHTWAREPAPGSPPSSETDNARATTLAGTVHARKLILTTRSLREKRASERRPPPRPRRPSHACAACSFLRCVSAGSWNVRWHLFVAMEKLVRTGAVVEEEEEEEERGRRTGCSCRTASSTSARGGPGRRRRRS